MNTPIITFGLGLLILGSAVMAGLFFVFSNFAMNSFARIRPEAGISAMQAINVTIVNPWFLALFLGTALGSVAIAVPALFQMSHPASVWILAGALFYCIGCIVVTGACNVPLNNLLAAVDPASADGLEMWNRYLREWLPWNHVRTVATTLAGAAYLVALWKLKE